MSKRLFFIIPLGLIFSSLTVFKLAPGSSESRLKYATGHLSVIHYGPPSDLSFCGESVPVDKQEVRERLERELMRHTQQFEATQQTLHRASRYHDEFLRIMNKMGVPEDFFYLAIAESNLSNASSPKGAQGFWQFMTSAANQYGLEISETVDERYHPEKATVAACRYLLDARKEFGSWSLVAAAYNMGSGGLEKAIREQKNDDYFSLRLNNETGNYVYRVLGYKCVFEYPGRYGFNVQQAKLHRPIPYKAVQITENIPNLATFAGSYGLSLETLKMMNPWLIADRLDVKPGKTYEVRIPTSDRVFAHELRVQRFAPGDSAKGVSIVPVDAGQKVPPTNPEA
ncbi:MAG: lytic transglycosylase domain-containing protein [Bacteroidetes bacterium]|nr:MAG: lytic transglycosylase domain-containing protein [Bacteroidota bacterium]